MDPERPDIPPEPVGSYPLVCETGSLVFLSGVGPRQSGSNEVPGNRYDMDGRVVSYDMHQQCHAVFANVRLILEQNGLRWKDLVDVTVYLTDMKQDFATFNAIWAEYFPQPGPCRTTVEVGALPTSIAIELKCIASKESNR
ncbi:MAG: RidA family protein [Xanthomonadales bacterium]|nr:RidA family protein [Xanthomonadales bacterium]